MKKKKVHKRPFSSRFSLPSQPTANVTTPSLSKLTEGKEKKKNAVKLYLKKRGVMKKRKKKKERTFVFWHVDIITGISYPPPLSVT